jgi:hypothetical protein
LYSQSDIGESIDRLTTGSRRHSRFPLLREFEIRNSYPRRPDLDLLPPHDHYTRLHRRHGAMSLDTKLILDELCKNDAN